MRATIVSTLASGTESHAIDLILELVALARVANEGPVRIGRTVFQKILFWAQMRLRALLWAAPHLSFYRHKYGPFSKDLAEDVDLLQRLGHIEPGNYRLSPRGAQLAEHWRGILEPANVEIFSAVDATAVELAPLSADEVKRRTYALPAEQIGVSAKYGTLEGVPLRVRLLLFGLAREQRPFVIDRDDLADLIVDLKITAKDVEASKRPGRAVQSAEELERQLDEHEPES